MARVVLTPLYLAAKGAEGLAKAAARFERNELLQHQYEFLVCYFMMNGLTQFMDHIKETDEKGKIVVVYDIKDAECSHLLHNLIRQYSGYDVAEYPEKLFIDKKNLVLKKQNYFSR